MRIEGVVENAKNEMPLSGSKISLYIGQEELAVLYSDNKGQFEYREAASYIGEILICQVEKGKYQAKNVTCKVAQGKVNLDAKLVRAKVMV
jgi:hypothetical protein